ncbi:M3 family metallopeptidase [Rickettsiella endosymbiont of Litargus connexus]|jgi:oligopeptidase A|uniref:M3 family metallopeptidase n=1 Tax=Rickettsiella endosymbiont of Litargus connexus TaxID=3066237 RepID=UPI0027FD8C91|nr:M3 family metallopeptidase [Gammaproteobacteria bacterium]MDD5161408.1 M3 family metallopeptidase [Candidatus Rickettsiella isopodorum]MDQ5899148.1 oligopeptidase [Pseudomonadota bacterium]
MMNALPKFNEINPKNIVRELDNLLDNNRSELAQLLAEVTPLDWSFIQKLDDLDDRLQQFWSPINHLYAVKQTSGLRYAYNECLPKLSAYSSELNQNYALYQSIKNLANSDYQFNYAQEKCLHNELRDFHLGGVDLPKTEQKRFQDIQTQLSQLSNQFEENLLDTTAEWSKHISDKSTLKGVPAYVIANAEKIAQEKKLTGFLITLDYPSYFPILTYADNRALRESIYKAHITRASELSNLAFDNSQVMFNILNLRHELSQILGFKNYAQKSLALNKMAKNPEDVLEFLQGLLAYAQLKAKEEWKELSTFAQSRDQIETLQAWDILYYREKLQEKKFGICDDTLRCYFPVDKVLSGLFNLIERLFGMQIKEIKGVEIWDPQVRFFAITDNQQQLRGQFYLDLYARPEKREGAWMDDYQSRRRLNNNDIQTPIAFLTCNFSPPIDLTQTPLLTHEEVLTLFHEFGHGLQHMLTIIDYSAVSGINGVAWDAVELPSQFLEYFVWEKLVLDQISSHYKTGKTLPETLIIKMREAKNFQAGLQLLRQLELSLFDFRVHLEFDPAKGYEQIQDLLDSIRKQIDIISIATFNRFQHGFSHIFAGGYAAGYYSYLWAEVLACDAFAKFQEDGIFNEETGKAFLHTILEQGGAIDAIELFKKFRGREPKIQAFLKNLDLNY